MNPGVLTSGYATPSLNAGLLGSPRPVAVPFDLAWSPRAIPNLALWLDARDSGSIVESGGQVSQWTDRSGFGRHATQTTANNRPTLFTSSSDAQGTTVATINDRQALYFDGVNDSMTLASSAIRNIQWFTLFAVVQFEAVGTNLAFNQNCILFHGGLNNRQAFQLNAYNATTSQWIVQYRRVGTDGYAGFASDTPRLALAGVPYIARAEHNYLTRSGAITVNRIATASGTITSNTPGVSADESLTALLGGPIGTSRLYGRIGSLLMYHRILDAPETAAVERYLADRWGIPLAT